MFVYRPPKSSCWGHPIGKDPVKAKQKLDAFVDLYLERVEESSEMTTVVAWKSAVLPRVDWPEACQGEKARQFLVLAREGRVMFPMGIVFPLSTIDAESFEFIGRFSKDAPFKMSAKHFMVGVIAKNGAVALRKVEGEMAAKLAAVIGR